MMIKRAYLQGVLLACGLCAVLGAQQTEPTRPWGTPPVPLKTCLPYYTPEALEARLSGDVTLRVRVGADGTVERARVTKSLDKIHGLDEQAIVAVAKWVFKPATLRGVAAPYDDVVITVSFWNVNGMAVDEGGCRPR